MKSKRAGRLIIHEKINLERFGQKYKQVLPDNNLNHQTKRFFKIVHFPTSLTNKRRFLKSFEIFNKSWKFQQKVNNRKKTSTNLASIGFKYS